MTIPNRDELISLTKELLLRLVNYFESGYEIFLCFCPSTEDPPKSELYKWFSKQSYKSALDDYFPNTNKFLERYRKLLNALKHSSNQLRIFQFINPENNGSTIGFYIEGVNSEGAVGPIADFHPLDGDKYTAWSYNLHLKNFYFLIYEIAFQAEQVVKKLCVSNSISLSELTNPLSSPNLESLAKDVFQNMARLNHPTFFHFPQEARESTKIPSLSEKHDALIFSDYKPGDRVVPKDSKAVMSAKGDGFSRNFSLPYFKGEEK